MDHPGKGKKRCSVNRYIIELKMDVEEYVPIVVHANGSDIDSLLADAEYSVDCPDPKKFYSIDNLSPRVFDRIVEEFTAEIAGQNEAAAESERAARDYATDRAMDEHKEARAERRRKA